LLANAAPDARLTTIDLPENWEGDFEIHVPEMMKNVTDRSAVGRQFRDTEFARRIVQVYGDSAKLDYSKFEGPFDLAFIDGCHFYDYVVSDTTNVMEHMNDSGVILWHDYGMLEDVSRAVDEFMKIGVDVISGTRIAVARVGSRRAAK
jgi:hypothetical protein